MTGATPTLVLHIFKSWKFLSTFHMQSIYILSSEPLPSITLGLAELSQSKGVPCVC